MLKIPTVQYVPGSLTEWSRSHFQGTWSDWRTFVRGFLQRRFTHSNKRELLYHRYNIDCLLLGFCFLTSLVNRSCDVRGDFSQRNILLKDWLHIKPQRKFEDSTANDKLAASVKFYQICFQCCWVWKRRKSNVQAQRGNWFRITTSFRGTIPLIDLHYQEG